MIPWIKIRTNLATDPNIGRLADALHCTDDTALGLVVKFWAWADGITADGRLPQVHPRRLDRIVGRRGFTDAMLLVGWLSDDRGELVVPHFTRHNGDSAKRRLIDAERMNQGRQPNRNRTGPSARSPPPADQTRPDQREKSRTDELIAEIASTRGLK